MQEVTSPPFTLLLIIIPCIHSACSLPLLPDFSLCSRHFPFVIHFPHSLSLKISFDVATELERMRMPPYTLQYSSKSISHIYHLLASLVLF